MNGLLAKATWAGIAEGVGGAPDEVKQFVQYLSINKAGLGAVAGNTAASYLSLGEGSAATVTLASVSL
jgi:hypothetical protein